MIAARAMLLHLQTFGHGPPLAIFHGLFGEGSNWKGIAKKLSSERELCVLDMPHHGRSPHEPELLNYDVMAAVARTTLLHHDGVRRWTLLGHSMGGKVAMRLAQRFPDLVEKLVVVDIAPKSYAPSHLRIFEGMNAIAATSLSSRREADEILAAFEPDPALRAFLLKNLVRDSREDKYRWKLNLPLIEKNYERICSWEADSAVFTGPSLFVYGGASSYVDADDEVLIRSLFPSAELAPIARAGHWPQVDAPDLFVDIVLRFLDNAAENA